jgi:hypothetical protein
MDFAGEIPILADDRKHHKPEAKPKSPGTAFLPLRGFRKYFNLRFGRYPCGSVAGTPCYMYATELLNRAF